MEIQNILIPTDFSASAEEMVQQALALAAREQAQVLLLHVLNSLAVTDTEAQAMYQLGQTMQEEAEQQLQAVAVQALVPIKTLVVWGTPASEICRVAKEHTIDLIVMSTHGRTGLAHILLGSVAERVVRHAPCAVLILRASLSSGESA